MLEPRTRNHVPLSVRNGGWRLRLDWWWRGRREEVALWLAPWFRFVGPRGMDAWNLSARRALRALELEEEVRQLRAELRRRAS